ncbi:MAG: hypothetical protein WC510_01520 [Candidatus Omnitrophota bacterium]
MRSNGFWTVDRANRLIFRRGRKKIAIDGMFQVSAGNNLEYWLNEPAAWRRQNSLPPKIVFRGTWKLNPNYDLELSLNKDEGGASAALLTLKGEIVSVSGDNLVFEFRSTDKKGLSHIRFLKLSGSWQADEANRLCFSVQKKGPPDIIILRAAWQINKNQQLTYTYEKDGLKRKDRIMRILTFQGHWQINEKNRITYILSRSTDSRFDFRVQLESPNLYPARGLIKYRLGIGIKDDKEYQDKIITLYGAWKLSRKLGLIFEMDYGGAEVIDICFGAQAGLTKKDRVDFYLVGRRNEPLGMSITFTHKFLKQQGGEWFLKLSKFHRDSRAEAGLRIPF